MSDTAPTPAAAPASLGSHIVNFLHEAEALLSKWLPTLITGAEVGATVTGNAELDPVIAAAGGAAEATIKAAQSAQNGDLAAAMTSVATAVSEAKTVAGIAPAKPTPAPAPAAS